MKKTVVIEGMMCGHCQAKVEKAFKEKGVEAVVSYEKGTAVIENCSLSDKEIEDIVFYTGFEFKEILCD